MPAPANVGWSAAAVYQSSSFVVLWPETAANCLACHSACNIDPLSRGIGVQN